MKIKLIIILFFTILFSSCNKLPQSEVKIVEQYFECAGNLSLENYDFCSDTEALCGTKFYNSQYGYALFSIPTPRNSELKFKEYRDDTIFYTCKSPKYSNDVYLQSKFRTGLDKGKGKTIHISVIYDFENTDCVQLANLKEKEKTTPIQGVPTFLEFENCEFKN
ncbi:hypothetical protein [uncultured Algibacter sp.]|uniref:hypothetical protein n=1 Tax=uncultured Algibacter sp. TaxID=298659 RepID=UPI00262FF007|nr:hypothetical protein [uncultured Algibacter sp.]